MQWFESVRVFAPTLLVGLAALYAVLTLVASMRWRRRRSPPVATSLPPVTILKPLCGLEPNLYEHLRTFCDQDYPEFQLIFGLRDPADPARQVAKRLADEFPQVAIDIVVNSRQHGSNRKISNLINMMEQARHDVLVVADSDTSVCRRYLSQVVTSLTAPNAGLATCLYTSIPGSGLWSRLGALYVNDWYIPSVLLARMFGYRGGTFGPTICIRKQVLSQIGGFASVANELADDFKIGEHVRRLGLRTEVSHYVVQLHHDEPDFAALMQHELRWMRTTRVLRPVSANFLFVSFSTALPLLGAGLASLGPEHPLSVWCLATVALIARIALHWVQRPPTDRGRFPHFSLILLRDLLIPIVWLLSFFSYRVSWRGSEFVVDTDGTMRPSLKRAETP